MKLSGAQISLGAVTILFGLVSFCPRTLAFRIFFIICAFLALTLLSVALLFEDEKDFLYEPEFENYKVKSAPTY